jgi:type 1 glutamine amidotransferase
MDHLKGRDSSTFTFTFTISRSRLQRSINKYGISNFEFVIYYFDIDPSVILTVTDIETVFCFLVKKKLSF